MAHAHSSTSVENVPSASIPLVEEKSGVSEGKQSSEDLNAAPEAETEASEHASAEMAGSVSDHGRVACESLASVPSKRNPFIMPPDQEIFLLRDKERQRKKKERIRQRKLHVHEKSTFSSRVHCRPAAMFHPSASDDELLIKEKAAAAADDIKFTLAITRDRHVEKESLAEYIAKKREMFLVQYSLGVKRDEMRKLEEIAQAEERKLELAEQFLEEDASMFDDFLKENDKNSVEAIKIAEAEAKTKTERLNDIKKIQIAIITTRSEISKFEETLKEYKTYKIFLDHLTPLELLPEKVQKLRKAAQEAKIVRVEDQGGEGGGRLTADSTAVQSHHTEVERHKKKRRSLGGLKPRRMSLKGTAHDRSPRTTLASVKSPQEKEQHSDTEETEQEDLELYFTDPHQVLNIFAELEERNLSLIQNSQETEETLEEVKRAIRETRKKMTEETRGLKDQIEKLNAAIKKEKEKSKQFKMKSKLFGPPERAGEESMDKEPVTLDSVVKEVYCSCITDNTAGMSTLEMMTTIENRLEELFDIIETIPPEKVSSAEKMKEKERRLKMREEKLEAQRIYQENRVRRALERARAEPKKMYGRKVVYRSQPPEMRVVKDDSEEQARRREEEEFNYFFTWR